MNQHEPIQLEYFTDVLCVWAWIAQPRLKELQKQWSGRIELQYRYIDVFGDCHKKIPTQWGAENGFEKFSEHVCHAASDYEETPVNSEVWRSCRPHSSMQAHLFLKAAEICGGASLAGQYAETIRQAFFVEAKDVGDHTVLTELASQSGIDNGRLQQELNSGAAIAALSADLRRAQEAGVKGSPTWVLNEGRQVLFGNVGYRILHANLEELLKHPQQESSWC